MFMFTTVFQSRLTCKAAINHEKMSEEYTIYEATSQFLRVPLTLTFKQARERAFKEPIGSNKIIVKAIEIAVSQSTTVGIKFHSL